MGGGGKILHEEREKQPVTPPVFNCRRQELGERKCLDFKLTLKFRLLPGVGHTNYSIETVFPKGGQKSYGPAQYSSSGRGRTTPY